MDSEMPTLLTLKRQIFVGYAADVLCENDKFPSIEKFHFHDWRRTIPKFMQLSC